MKELMSRLEVSITGPLVSSMSSILPPKTKPSREVAKKERTWKHKVTFHVVVFPFWTQWNYDSWGQKWRGHLPPPPRHKKVQEPAPQPGSWLCGAFGENFETHPTWPIKLSLPELLSLSPLLPDVVWQCVRPQHSAGVETISFDRKGVAAVMGGWREWVGGWVSGLGGGCGLRPLYDELDRKTCHQGRNNTIHRYCR